MTCALSTQRNSEDSASGRQSRSSAPRWIGRAKVLELLPDIPEDEAIIDAEEGWEDAQSPLQPNVGSGEPAGSTDSQSSAGTDKQPGYRKTALPAKTSHDAEILACTTSLLKGNVLEHKTAKVVKGKVDVLPEIEEARGGSNESGKGKTKANEDGKSELILAELGGKKVKKATGIPRRVRLVSPDVKSSELGHSHDKARTKKADECLQNLLHSRFSSN